MKTLFLLFLGLSFFLAACAPSEEQLQATGTELAANIYASLTAQVPTPTWTTAPTRTPAATSTPVADAIVNVSLLKAFSEPVISNASLYEFSLNDGLIVSGRDRDCNWLQVHTPFGDTAWVNTQLDRITLLTPCEGLPHGFARLENAAVIFDRRQSAGNGELQVDNGLLEDGYILLLDPDDVPVVGYYIRANSEITIEGIPDGSFTVYVSTGELWDLVDFRFAEVVRYEKFEEPFQFSSTTTTYTIWEITLHPVEGGTADVESLSPDEFPIVEP